MDWCSSRCRVTSSDIQRLTCAAFRCAGRSRSVLHKRLHAARNVAGSLIETENSIDVAIQAAAQLSCTMIAGRNSAGLSALFGQEALEEVVQAQVAMAEARRRLVEAHKKLTAVKHDMGLDAFAAGDGAPKPPLPIFTEGQDNGAVAV